MPSDGARVERMCDAIVALRACPMTSQSLASVLDADPSTIWRYVRMFHARNLIEPHGREHRPRGIKPIIWRWVP